MSKNSRPAFSSERWNVGVHRIMRIHNAKTSWGERGRFNKVTHIWIQSCWSAGQTCSHPECFLIWLNDFRTCLVYIYILYMFTYAYEWSRLETLTLGHFKQRSWKKSRSNWARSLKRSMIPLFTYTFDPSDAAASTHAYRVNIQLVSKINHPHLNGAQFWSLLAA